ncbi:MAG: radical SAM protein [Chlamydiae bacterium]|nr:radical SAM protein [Chlamydiota bacterium]
MLKVNEIYKSIQGESSFVGLPCVFVRLTGCHLRCTWCDTAYAFHEGEDMTVEEVVKKVRGLGPRLFELTGGEPLLQEDAFPLVERLLKLHDTVLVETSGAVDVACLDKQAVKIMDIKCPASGMSDKMIWENLNYLTPRDEIKFVIQNRSDFDWACRVIEEHDLLKKSPILFSPVFGQLNPQELAEWILKENLNVRMQLQIHKYIWSVEVRGV